MFRIGGSAGTGITSGLDRKPLKQGTDLQDRAFKPDINQALDVAELPTGCDVLAQGPPDHPDGHDPHTASNV